MKKEQTKERMRKLRANMTESAQEDERRRNRDAHRVAAPSKHFADFWADATSLPLAGGGRSRQLTRCGAHRSRSSVASER